MIATLVLVAALAQDTTQVPRYRSEAFEVTTDAVRQGRFEARALGRDTIVSTYPRAAREVHFKFALNGRDSEFPPGIEHTINLRPRGGRIVTALYAFAVPPRPLLPRPEDANEGEDGDASVTIRLDLRAVRTAIARQGWYKPPLGDTIRSIGRVTAIGDTDPLVWDINAVGEGAPHDLTDPDGSGIYEATLAFRTEYLRPLDDSGRAIWARTADLSRFPELVSPEPLLDATYRLSLEELTQLVREDGALSAGAKWPGVWTRDISLSALLSLAIVAPDAVKVSLMRKVDSRGRIIQDTGTGGSWPVSTDRMTWALAAWEVYAVTGDQAWLRESYAIIKRSAEADAHAALDPATGLFKGESSFEDWREQSYPRWMQPADIGASFALGTNAVHFGAYRVLADMGRALDAPGEEVAQWEARAKGVADGIGSGFWIPELQRHAQFIYGRVSLSQSPRYEALGEALLLITGGAAADSAAAISGFAPRVAFGVPTFWPFIADVPFYHNATIWPFVTSYATWAAARAGNGAGVEHGLAAVTRGTALFLTNKENLVAETGHFEGTALNSDRQLWSVAGTLAMQYRVLFGLRFLADSLSIEPFVPAAYAGERELRGLSYRRATLNIKLLGAGDCVRRTTVDGVEVSTPAIPGTIEGTHDVALELESCGEPVVPIRFVDARFAPATPTARLTTSNRILALAWGAVPGARRYVIHRNAQPVDTVRVRRYPVTAGFTLDEWQVEALDSLDTGSFLSEPVRVVMAGIERSVRLPSESVELGRPGAEEARNEWVLPIARDGRYAIDMLYSNGNGPINTEDKVAVRTVLVDGKPIGVVVMPQRGTGNWTEQGWTAPFILRLHTGQHRIALVWDTRDENMNGTINDARIHRIRISRLPDEPKP